MARTRGMAEAVWRERLARFQTSRLSIGAFCKREGVSASSFHAWKRRLRSGTRDAAPRRKAKVAQDKQPLFVPVPWSGSSTVGDSGLRITFPGGAVVHVPLEVDERVLTCILEAAIRASQEGRPC